MSKKAFRPIASSDNIYDEDVHKPLVDYKFEKVNQLKENEWLTSINAYELARLWESEQLVYYPETQRGVINKKGRNGKKDKDVPIRSEANIKAIQGLIMRGKYFPDTLTLNILSEDNGVLYDAATSELDIKDGLLCILDGYHRIKAIHNIYLYTQEFNFDLTKIIFPVKITNYDREEAKRQFRQYSLGMKINSSRSESFNLDDAVSNIVRELNFHGALEGLINDKTNSITEDNKEHIVAFATLTQAIRDTFKKIDSEKDEEEILAFLQEYFEELMLLFPQMRTYEGRRESKDYELVCENFFFYVWISFAKKLYDNVVRFQERNKIYNWKKEMSYLSKVDFGRECSTWADITKDSATKGRVIVHTKVNRQSAYEDLLSELELIKDQGM